MPRGPRGLAVPSQLRGREGGTQPPASPVPSLPRVLALGVLKRQAEAPLNSLRPHLNLRKAGLLGQNHGWQGHRSVRTWTRDMASYFFSFETDAQGRGKRSLASNLGVLGVLVIPRVSCKHPVRHWKEVTSRGVGTMAGMLEVGSMSSEMAVS